MSNTEIDEYLEEKGFEFEDCADLRNECDVTFYNNHRTRVAVVMDYRLGVKNLFKQVDNVD